ncbi:MAG TPA: ABC transporter ATP-binding protein/permease [Chromatiaceae bacterium]|jgi:ATP-binding cassette subfamily B protein|nr:ABC transporter ATP-binding protein/permease [Chromatiaceae bacterium]HIN82657.1 ABC transporter ATP-binding protein/permease [Chromatiales bacterium]HIO13729.1 ABC transporter ATP-binding protein/permease [Chromatiales bacterium]HIO54827.1 ABC transporter ATP-binding protein/permease [Chromatiales bacterium]
MHTLYTSEPHTDRRDWQNIRAMAPLLWDYRGRAALALLSLVLAKVANVGVPLVLKEIVDSLDATGAGPLVLPLTFLLGYGALRLAASLFNELRDAVFAKVRYRAMRQISLKVLRHLHELSLRFHLQRKTGAISQDLDRGTRSLSSILNYLLFNILPTMAEFVLVASILFSQYDAKFAFVTFLTVAAYVIFTLMVTEWRMHFRLTMNALDSEANSRSVDSLINYETVKYFGNEELELNRYDSTLEKWEHAAVQSQTSMSALNFGQGSIIAVGVTFLMIFAANGVVSGEMSMGDLVLVNALLLQLFIPLNFLGIVYRQLKYSFADMDLMVKLLETEAEVQDAEQATSLKTDHAKVCFDAVNFSYQPERPILKDFSLTLEPGKKVAVVGPSGAGKSTLARLLFRFYDVTDGSITIDGQDIREVTQDSLRAAIGIVPQDVVLFNDTLYYNLAYARPDASRAEIEQAAAMAHIKEFIESLPDAYETMVGERGLKLSGGEKQRVAIARAILKQPSVLVFDEATSALDTKTEQDIQETLAEVAKNRTTLVIAHRLSTIVDADQIVVLDQGSIVERGTHEELLAHNGHYLTMWELQKKEPQGSSGS